MTTLTKLKDLARRAGTWLGLGAAVEPQAHTTAVPGDRFDELTWTETLGEAAALRNLGADLGERYDHVGDLLHDVFLGVYKTAPTVRSADEMQASRRVNQQVIASMIDAPELTELRRETAGDEYAAAMAVLAQGGALRELLERTKDAQEAAEQAEQAEQEAAAKAEAVAAALAAAEAASDDEGMVPEDAAAGLERAMAEAAAADAAAQAAAQGAHQALAAAAPGVRAAARQGMAEASEAAQEEAALMAAWGVSPGQLQRMSFQARAQLAERLRTGRLGEFADLIGRFRQMATGERARKVEGVPGELVGVTLGDDLSRLVPSEIAALAVPALRAEFAARLAESRLMLFESRGEEKAGQGAIIACVDCSGSMEGGHAGRDGRVVTREAWAKACALALLDQAQKAGRDFVGILFSSRHQVKTFRFPGSVPAPLAEVIEFGEHFFDGGTDFEAPLSAAVEVLQDEYNAEGKQRGDIVLITDGACAVGEEWLEEWRQLKAQLGFRTFGVSVGGAYAGRWRDVLETLCDDLRSVDDLADPGPAREMFRVI